MPPQRPQKDIIRARSPSSSFSPRPNPAPDAPSDSSRSMTPDVADYRQAGVNQHHSLHLLELDAPVHSLYSSASGHDPLIEPSYWTTSSSSLQPLDDNEVLPPLGSHRVSALYDNVTQSALSSVRTSAPVTVSEPLAAALPPVHSHSETAAQSQSSSFSPPTRITRRPFTTQSASSHHDSSTSLLVQPMSDDEEGEDDGSVRSPSGRKRRTRHRETDRQRRARLTTAIDELKQMIGERGDSRLDQVRVVELGVSKMKDMTLQQERMRAMLEAIQPSPSPVSRSSTSSSSSSTQLSALAIGQDLLNPARNPLIQHLDYTNTCVCVLGLDGTILRVNEGFTLGTGWSKELAEGELVFRPPIRVRTQSIRAIDDSTPAAIADLQACAGQPHFANVINYLNLGPTKAVLVTCTFQAADDSVNECKAMMTLCKNAEGQPSHILCTVSPGSRRVISRNLGSSRSLQSQ